MRVKRNVIAHDVQSQPCSITSTGAAQQQGVRDRQKIRPMGNIGAHSYGYSSSSEPFFDEQGAPVRIPPILRVKSCLNCDSMGSKEIDSIQLQNFARYCLVTRVFADLANDL